MGQSSKPTNPAALTLTPSHYRKLRDDLAVLFADGQAALQRASAPILAETYWKVGKRIAAASLTKNAGYGSAILRRLAEDLSLNPRTLQQALQVFRSYPRLPSSPRVKWAHLRELVRIRDEDERRFYEGLVEDKQLSRDGLVKAMRRGAYRHGAEAKSAAGNDSGGGTEARKLLRPTGPTFVYAAYPHRVIDGDTLQLDVDLGFEVVIRQRVRLRGVDTPPNKNPDGKNARRFVEDELARAASVVIKTHRTDLHGRYVADLFYTSQERPREDVFLKGRHLNQRLLDRGFATPA